MHKQIIPFVFLISFQLSIAQITLTHNTGNSPVPSDMYSCDYEEIWARAFRLSDFGITINEQFIINSGQVAISNSYDGAMLVFSIYSIDSNFPNSEPKRVSYGNVVTAPEIGDTPEIVQIEFANPVVVPANVERILVEVSQMDDIYNDDFKKLRLQVTNLMMVVPLIFEAVDNITPSCPRKIWLHQCPTPTFLSMLLVKPCRHKARAALRCYPIVFVKTLLMLIFLVVVQGV